MDKNGRLEDALLKVALGYQLAEVTEEYAEVDGALKLTKRKKTKKDIPPDLKAVQLLLSGGGVEQMSDEELEAEKERLLAVLRAEEDSTKKKAKNQEKEGQVCVEGETQPIKKARPKPRKRVIRKKKYGGEI